MGELVFIQNDRILTDSLTVAEAFDKRHDLVVRDIENLECSDEFSLRNFEESTYENTRGRKYRKYLITQDGFSFLVMGYTGKRAAEFKEKYILEFNQMREQLNNKVQVLDERKAILESLKLTVETVERQDKSEKRLDELEIKVDEQITLYHGEQRRLQKAVANQVYQYTEDKKLASSYFRELYREIKDRFGVASYKDVKRKDLQTALRYVESWLPRKVS